ncbi:MAG TPA: hypothetical protein VD767_09260 [Thermomicrobiales bacterium]|nr:hypothetical protein [Thermomicrobiales bacterium]
MSVLRRLFGHGQAQVGTSRFNTYYTRLLQEGTGYPTADEARRDLKSYDASYAPYTWPR